MGGQRESRVASRTGDLSVWGPSLSRRGEESEEGQPHQLVRFISSAQRSGRLGICTIESQVDRQASRRHARLLSRATGNAGILEALASLETPRKFADNGVSSCLLPDGALARGSPAKRHQNEPAHMGNWPRRHRPRGISHLQPLGKVKCRARGRSPLVLQSVAAGAGF